MRRQQYNCIEIYLGSKVKKKTYAIRLIVQAIVHIIRFYLRKYIVDECLCTVIQLDNPLLVNLSFSTL
jgi:hypothetical protein